MATKRGWLVGGGGNGRDIDSQLVEFDEPEPPPTKHDWKALAAIGSLALAIMGAALAIQHRVFLGDVRQLIADHAAERGIWRGDVSSRLVKLEQHCEENRKWVDRADNALDSLQNWRTNCSAKVQGLIQYQDSDGKAMAELSQRIGTIEGFVYRRAQP